MKRKIRKKLETTFGEPWDERERIIYKAYERARRQYFRERARKEFRRQRPMERWRKLLCGIGYVRPDQTRLGN